MTNYDLLSARRQMAVDALAAELEIPLRRYQGRQSWFWNPDYDLHVGVAVSKRHEDDHQLYWYTYNPAWNDFLEDCERSCYLLACMDRDEAYAIPFSVLRANLKNLNTTTRNGISYSHVMLARGRRGALVWDLSKVQKKIPLSEYAVSL